VKLANYIGLLPGVWVNANFVTGTFKFRVRSYIFPLELD